MRAVWMTGALLAGTLAASATTAQTWGQPYHRAPAVTWGQPHGTWGGGLTEWDGRAYAATGYAATGRVNGPAPAYGGHSYGGAYGYGGGYGDPGAYRPPSRYGQGYGHGYRPDRGGRYGYSTGNRWTRWSSPPGRGYHDAYGYNDDRAPRGTDYGHDYGRDCDCGGPYLYDR